MMVNQSQSMISQSQRFSLLNQELTRKFQASHLKAIISQLKLMVFKELHKLMSSAMIELGLTSFSISRLTDPLANEDDCYGIEDFPFDDEALHNMNTQLHCFHQQIFSKDCENPLR